MAGQLFSVSSEGGFLYSDQLSDILRLAVQPLVKLRQFCDVEEQLGLHAGDTARWNVYSDLGTQGGRLAETTTMPETNFTIVQNTVTLVEFGNSVPYTGKLEALGKHDVEQIIHKVLKHDARKCFDIEAYEVFDDTPLRVTPTSGTSETALSLVTDGIATVTNNVDLGNGHIKAAVDTMKERNIPPYEMDDYMFLSHPTTIRPVKNDLESISQYTDAGIQIIYNGEAGRYDGVRFVEQNHIPKGGAYDTTTFDPWSNTADAWNNALSSWGFFFGADTAVEAVAIPEEIRAKIPGDFGRSKGIAWYAIAGFAINHDEAAQARILKWDSAA